MSHATFPPRSAARWLAPALALVAAATAAPASAAGWRLEPIAASTGVVELHDLDFDAHGNALLSWSGSSRDRVAPLLGAVALRDPAGGWLRSPDLAGVQAAGARIHMVGAARTLLVAREEETRANRRRLVVAEGLSDGGFGPLAALDDFVSEHWSDASASGDAIVAWLGERSPFIRVAERSAGQPFGPPRDLAVGRTAAVAINARGDRVLAWRAGRRLAARVRPAGGEWSPTARFGRVRTIAGLRLSVLAAPSGRIVLAWGRVGGHCGVSVRDGAARWRTRALERRCGPAGVPASAAPVLAVADDRGATYVAWTGRTRSGRRAVKLARVGARPSRAPLVLSRERGALLDDVAAGPRRALAITYVAPRPTKANPLLGATFAVVRRGGGAFGPAERLTPPGFAALRGSRVAFQPLTGEPVVALPFLIGLETAVAAAVGPPAPAP
ncbi:MAG TPA: hypothetical protein VG474_16560 [Solirubrobacteraceae bacterium]|nr:hypothetical protein [Solirubrobacteraceae bacterium]